MSVITITKRKKCSYCGYDRGLTVGIDTPVSLEDLEIAAQPKNWKFSTHEHKTIIQTLIEVFPYDMEQSQ